MPLPFLRSAKQYLGRLSTAIILTLEQQVAAMLPDLWLDASETYAKSKIACDLNGTADFMNSDNSITDFDFADVDISVFAMFNPDVLSTFQVLGGKWSEAGNDRCYQLVLNASDYLEFQVSNDGTTEVLATCAVSTVSTGTWYYAVGTHDATANEIGVYLYSSADGTLIDSDTTAHTTGINNDTAQNYIVGKNVDGNFFNGQLDQNMVFNSTLSSAEMLELTSSGTGLNYRDLDGTETFYSNIVAWYDMNVPTHFGRNYAAEQHAVHLNAGNYYEKQGQPFNFEIDDSFSGSAWVRFDSLAANYNIMGEYGHPLGWSFKLGNGTNTLGMWLATNTTDRIRVSGSTVFSTDTWYHIAFTYDGSSASTGVKLYVNGVRETIILQQSGTPTTIVNGTNPFRIGNFSVINGIIGSVDQESIYTGVLTDGSVAEGVTATGQIATLYNSGVPLDYVDTIQTNMLAYYGFNGQTVSSAGLDSHTGSLNLTSTSPINLVGGVGSLDLLETGIDKNNAVLGHVSGNASGYDGVTKWTDRGAQGNDVIQATVTKVPMWLENTLNTTEDTVLFGGTDDELESFSGSFDLGWEDEFSGSALIKRTFIANQGIMGQTDGNGDGYWLRIVSNKLMLALASAPGSNEFKRTGTTALAIDTWYHVGFSYDGSKTIGGLKVYVNGIEEDNGSPTNTLTADFARPAQHFTVGANAGDEFTGEMAQVKMFPSVLTDANFATITAYYNEKYDLGL